MSCVTIGRTPDENTCVGYYPISRFQNILEDYAHIFDIDIEAQRLKDILPVSAHAGVAVVNFFEEGSAEKNYTTRKSAFGYVFQEEVRSLPAATVIGGIHTTRLLDFDSVAIAHVIGYSLYIDFDFLRTCWNGHDEVLRIILAWGLAHIVKSTESDRSAAYFAEYVRTRCAEKRESESRKFASWLKRTSEKSLQRYEQKLLASVQVSNENEARYVEAIQRVDAFEAFSRAIAPPLSTEQLEDDFDRLRKLVGVAKVKITEEGRIAVATHRLSQIFPPPSEALQSTEPSSPYDVGSIEFSIDPLAELSTSIHFRSLEKGTHRNHFFFFGSPNNAKILICFGNNASNGGMNTAIDKLLVGYKIPNVAALVLTFFRFVNMRPVAMTTEEAMVTPSESVCGAHAYTDEDWEREKKAYVVLMRATMHTRTSKERVKEQNTLVDEREGAFSAVKKCWEAASELVLVRRYVQTCAATSALNAEAILDTLHKHPQVLGFDMENGLRIWFNVPNVFKYPSILWIQEDGAVRLVSFFEYWGSAENHAIRLDYHGEKRPMELLARGAYAELISVVMDVAYNWMQQAYEC